jgi:hypothetical protein
LADSVQFSTAIPMFAFKVVVLCGCCSCFVYVVCRDALLASLLDGVRASGNRDVHVKMMPTLRGKRIGPLSVPVEEEVHMPQTAPHILSFSEPVRIVDSSAVYWLYWKVFGWFVSAASGDTHETDSVTPNVRVTVRLMVSGGNLQLNVDSKLWGHLTFFIFPKFCLWYRWSVQFVGREILI